LIAIGTWVFNLIKMKKRSGHIKEIYLSVTNKVSALRKIKFTLSRKTLNRIYLSFILPCLEYACEVWDGCTLYDADSLEKVQLEAARIVTGNQAMHLYRYLYILKLDGKLSKKEEKFVNLTFL